MSQSCRQRNIKRAQKQSYILHEITPLLSELLSNDNALSKLFVSKVELSPDGGMCHIFFSTFSSKEDYTNASEALMLYKPSVRKALATILNSKYTPDVRFHYDAGKDKERHMNKIFEKISDEDRRCS
ncbi:ribosome-binding factor A [Candidatus Dependentiae bacterium]